MKNLALIIMLSLVVSFGSNLQAQSITIEGAQQLTTFKFTDSQGTVDKDYIGSYNNAFYVGFRNLDIDGLFITAGLGLRDAGATLVYDNANYIWDLQYATVKAGAGYVFGLGTFQPYVSITPYFSYLLKASQTLNHEVFDMIHAESIERMDYGIIGSPGVTITISDYISTYVEVGYLMGLANLENSDSGQTANNQAYSFTVGLSLSFQSE